MLPALGEQLEPMHKFCGALNGRGPYRPVNKITLKLLYYFSKGTYGSHLVACIRAMTNVYAILQEDLKERYLLKT